MKKVLDEVKIEKASGGFVVTAGYKIYPEKRDDRIDYDYENEKFIFANFEDASTKIKELLG